jgi:hypothetical protein
MRTELSDYSNREIKVVGTFKGFGSVKGKKKALKITWKKQKGVSGYRIEIATNRKFTKNLKSVTIKKASRTSKTIKKLKSKQTWYVRIYACKKTAGGQLVGKWSKVQKAKTK